MSLFLQDSLTFAGNLTFLHSPILLSLSPRQPLLSFSSHLFHSPFLFGFSQPSFSPLPLLPHTMGPWDARKHSVSGCRPIFRPTAQPVWSNKGQDSGDMEFVVVSFSLARGSKSKTTCTCTRQVHVSYQAHSPSSFSKACQRVESTEGPGLQRP